jgi:ubiquinone/menaquinone biosynthesis C-methylase UbiE
MANFWDLYAMVYDSLPNHFTPYRELIEQIIWEVREYSNEGTIMDAGCGTGNFSLALAKIGYGVTGIDYSESMLKRAEKKKENAGDCDLQFLKLDLTNGLPYPDNYFDMIISIHTLYTIRNTAPVLKEYYRILRPTGRFILSETQRPVAIMPTLREAMQRSGLGEVINVFYHLFILGIFNIIIAERQASGFYHYWNESELKEKLLGAGFKIISVKATYTNNLDLLVISTKPKTNI